MSFDGNLDALVCKSFDLDELGLKGQIRMTGLGFAKNPKWPENEWTPEEKIIDGKITLQFVSLGSNRGYYTCKIPSKGDGPDLVNNMNEVIARQSRTNAGAYFSKKGTSIDEVNAKLQDYVDKGYIEKIDIQKENIKRIDSYFLSYFPVVN
jgi:hypothetical protein